jgi:uncharacterized alpha-E superfamily protein
MYRLCKRTRVARTDVLEFVVRGDQFPRACLFCLKQIEQGLLGLPRSAGVLEVLAGVIGFLDDAQLGSLDLPGLHELIDRLQLHIIGVHDGIAQTYFPLRSGTTTVRQLQWMESGVTTLPLFADAPS